MNAVAPKSRPRSPSTARGLWLSLALGLLIGAAAPARSQAADAGDPPARVARVGEVVGDAWLFDPDSREWTRLVRNQTVGEGDRLRTDERARLSLRIGSSSLWVDERSDLEFSQLDEGRVQLQLDRGDVGLRLRAQELAGDFRIQTHEGRVLPESEGLYRVEQLDRGSRAYVWQGRLRFEPARGDGGVAPTMLQGGEQAEFWWAEGPRVERQRLESDEFGDWMQAQSRRDGDLAVASQRYVSPEMTGAEDLDRNGRWEAAGEFGTVWIPSQVAPDWAPYRDGRWVWTRHWGWTWVDDMPWGFAPFHYGRWVQWGGRWCWSPGAYVARPVYAPALVAWVGGPAVGVGLTIGSRPPPPRYGWYPLAPREAYVPAYRHSPVYVRRVNGFDPGRNPPPPHRNRDVHGAISYVPNAGGPVRAMPVGEVRPGGPIAAPPREDFGRQLPQRPASEVAGPRPPPNMSWRSDNSGRDRRERGGSDRRNEGFEPRGAANPMPGRVNPAPANAVPVMPAMPAMPPRTEAPAGVTSPPAVQPVQPVQPQPGRNRAFDNGRERDAREERGERGERANSRGWRGPERAPELQPQQMQPQQVQPQPPRAFERQPERAPERARPFEVAPQPQPQPQAQPARPQPQPQLQPPVQAQPQPQRPQPQASREEPRGGPRRPDAQPDRGNGNPRRNEPER